MQTSRRYQDIAIINIARAQKENAEPKKGVGWLTVLTVITLAVVLVVCGYLIGVHSGRIPAHDPLCCVYGLDLDFDFEFGGAGDGADS